MVSYMEDSGFDKHLDALANVKLISCDTETTGFGVRDNSDYLMGISTAYRLEPFGLMSCYFPFRHEDDNLEERHLIRLRNIFEDKAIVFHNLAFDLMSLDTIKIKPQGRLFCTMLIAHMINENWPSKSLDWLSKTLLNDEKSKKPIDTWTKIWSWKEVPAKLMAPYACQDAELTYRLFEYLWPKFKEQNLEHLWNTELDYCRLLVKMMQVGIKTDRQFCDDKIKTGLEIMNECRTELGFNPSSGNDLHKFLIEELKLPVVKLTSTDKPSFDKYAMEKYDELLEVNNRKEAQLVLTYRGWQKSVSSLYESMNKLQSPWDGRVHCGFKQHGTKTGRLSCAEPNLQQIPRESTNAWNGDAKKAFIAEDGFSLVEFDYSQLEFRLATAYGQDKELLDSFESGEDVFIPIAIRVFGGEQFRQNAKTLVYSTLYGGGVPRLMVALGLSADEAKRVWTGFRKSYPGIYDKAQLAARNVQRNGYVKYWTGRKRHLNKDDSHKAFNAAVQGGASEIVKRSSLRVDRELCNESCRMVLTVHDSIILEIRHDLVEDLIPKVSTLMTDWNFGVKFAVDSHVWGTK